MTGLSPLFGVAWNGRERARERGGVGGENFRVSLPFPASCVRERAEKRNAWYRVRRGAKKLFFLAILFNPKFVRIRVLPPHGSEMR